MMFPVVAYAPTAATKPSIAAHPLNLSASGVILVTFVVFLCFVYNDDALTIMSEL